MPQPSGWGLSALLSFPCHLASLSCIGSKGRAIPEACHRRLHTPPDLVVRGAPAQRNPPDVRIWECVPPFTHGVFTGLYDSRGQLCFVNPTMQSRTCLQLAVFPHWTESRSCAWQVCKVA